MYCPFCGSTNIDPRFWLNGKGEAGPGCDDCGATAESPEIWNKRFMPTAPLQYIKLTDDFLAKFEELMAKDDPDAGV